MDPAGKQRLDVTRLGDMCLGYLVEDPALLARFMDIAGYTPAGLRKAAGTEALAAGTIDYFASNETLMLALCAANGTTPEAFMRVWHKLNRFE